MASNPNSGGLGGDISNMKKEDIRTKVVVKVGMLGDSQIGKTTLMVRYIENRFDEDYIETLGVNFMEKIIHLKNVDVTISVWDLGGQKEFATLMPLVCGDAKVVLFAFDLTLRQSLFAVKRWYKEARKENKNFMPFLVGTKFDLFDPMHDAYKQEITRQARKFARKMHAPLIYCSSAKSINVKKIFKIIIAKVFHLKPKIPESHNAKSEPILEYTETHAHDDDGARNTTENGAVAVSGSSKKRSAKGGTEEEEEEEEEDGGGSSSHRKKKKKKKRSEWR